MTQIVMTSNQSDFDNLDGSIKARFGSFLAKLLADDTNPSCTSNPCTTPPTNAPAPAE